MTRALRYALVIGSAVGSILLFLLASASDNSGFFDRYYSWLLGLNAAVAAMLVVFVEVALWRLVSRYPEADRARGFLEGYLAGQGAAPAEDLDDGADGG